MALAMRRANRKDLATLQMLLERKNWRFIRPISFPIQRRLLCLSTGAFEGG